jgi:hypothetical protein
MCPVEGVNCKQEHQDLQEMQRNIQLQVVLDNFLFVIEVLLLFAHQGFI